MKTRPGLLLLSTIIVTLVIICGLFLDQNNAMVASDQPNTDISLGVVPSQQLVVRFFYDSQQQLDAVAGQLDIWEVHPLPEIGPGSGYAVVALYPSQRDWLEVLGYRVEIDTEKTALLESPMAVLDPRYYYFDSFYTNLIGRYMLDAMEATNLAYPDLTELMDIGDAWLASHGGYTRDIWVLRISNEDPMYGDVASKPAFFLMANIHAREVTTPEMAIRYIKYLTDGYLDQGGYGIDPDVTWLVNHHVVYILVSQNPDGHVNNEANTAAYWRKNVDSDDGCSDLNYWGVDLNRNSSFEWGCCGGSSGSPCSETYRGPARASEPETAALQSFFTQVFIDWNGNNSDDQIVPSPDDASGLFITLHSYADDILWPWGFAPGTAPNDTQLRAIGRKLAEITGVMNPTGGIGYLVDGSTDDWIYGKLGVAAFTYEIGPNNGSCGGFFPAYECQDGIDGVPRNFWNEMKASFIYANKISPMPYQIVYGPDAVDISAAPDEAPGGTPIYLSATIRDQRYGSDPLQPVMAAEYFIDTPGENGTGTAMIHSDGDWGESSEAVEAIIDTSRLAAGQHYILVHGLNDDGFWGPFTAVFLYVTTPAYEVLLTPEIASRQDDPGQIVTYQLQVENIGLYTDSYDITVNATWPVNVPAAAGPLNPGENTAFDVSITIPPDAIYGESDTAAITAISQYNANITDTSSLITAVNALYSFQVFPLEDNQTAHGRGIAITYTVFITNTGDTPDSYNIDVLSSEWEVEAPTQVGPVAQGETSVVFITIWVPIDIFMGDFNNATLAFISQGSNDNHQVQLYTDTFWNSFYLPITQKN